MLKYSRQQLLRPLDCSFRLKLLVRGFDFLLVTAVAEAFCHTGYKFEHSVTMRVSTRVTSILGEVYNVKISRVTKQLLYSKSNDFLVVFALGHSKINQIA